MDHKIKRSTRVTPGIRTEADRPSITLPAGTPLNSRCLPYQSSLNGSALHQHRAKVQAARNQNVLALNEEQPKQIYLSLDQKGNLLIANEQAEPLGTHAKRQALKQYESYIVAWLTEQMELINGDMDLILGIHHDTPMPGANQPQPLTSAFNQPEPEPPTLQPLPNAPEPPEPPVLKSWERLIPPLGKKKKARHTIDLLKWRLINDAWVAQCETLKAANHKAKSSWLEHQAKWQEEQKHFNQEQEQVIHHFNHALHHNSEFMAELLIAEINQLDWFSSGLIEFELLDHQHGLIRVELPTPDMLPQRTARFGANGRRLLIKDKTRKKRYEEYNWHVHGVLLRLLGVAFTTLSNLNELSLTGYTNELNSDPGTLEKNTLIQVKASRSQFNQLNGINTEDIEPCTALAQFDLVLNISKTGLLLPIQLAEA